MKAKIKTRRYDKEKQCYVYDISFKTKTKLTERTAKVAEAFGLGLDNDREQILFKDFQIRLHEGDVVYITGESGSGKSVLLNALKEDLKPQVACLSDVKIDENMLLIDTVGSDFKEAVKILSSVGLNDAFLFLQTHKELSEGQKYRHKIAAMIDENIKFWLADEFCSTLDRTTAKIVAYNMQKLARREKTTLIVATSHNDLQEDLQPTIMISKGWGREAKIEYLNKKDENQCSILKEAVIREGNKQDYFQLSEYHYRDSRLPIPIKIYAATIENELAGVVAYCYPAVNANGRRQSVGYVPQLPELNRDWAVVSRIIIHPKYRGIGLAVKLLRETLVKLGRKHVELIAVMAEYNPFAEHAGMKPILKNPQNQSVSQTLEALKVLGFNPLMMSSQKYNVELLQEMASEDLDKVREALLKISPGLFKRINSRNRPFMKKNEMEAWLKEQSPERIGRCLYNLAVLAQNKAYLYWCRDWVGYP